MTQIADAILEVLVNAMCGNRVRLWTRLRLRVRAGRGDGRGLALRGVRPIR